jgi:type IV pilus assembly protein PilA
MKKLMKNNKAFTLVEVIVVAVIVAVLALVAIQLYQGYVKDSRKNTAQNLAASAAGYLQTERNRGSTITVQDYTGPAKITVTAASGNTDAVFNVPSNAVLKITGGSSSGGTVQAVVGPSGGSTESSDSYYW